MDLITIASDALAVCVNQTGAELWSITDQAGRNYMTDADPAFWTGHAPVLFPVIGSVAHDRIVVDGQVYPMARHGFARHAHFEIVERGADHVRFRLGDSDATRTQYPFAFQLDLAFRVSGWHVEVTAHVTNPGDTDMPFSFGFHPAFAWPLPGGADKSAHRLTFAHDEPEPIHRLDQTTGLLLPEPAASPVVCRDLPLTSDLFDSDAIVWTDQRSRALTYGAPGGASLDIAFPDSPMLGLWQKPGAHYICIEPWQGYADPQGFDGDFATKPGLVILPPGDTHSLHLSIMVHPS
ncbi:aldose 1-epimerase family protein [Novosphingobium sp.]|uniref:aldose 1-epimerase family protein n=1 Tax=Novosphingobium sp. TaxID=1874826 RepID=UPI003D0B92AC